MNPQITTPSGHTSQRGEPTWEIASLFPDQGDWSEAAFLALPSPHRFELCDGKLELLPMATWLHQEIAWFLCECLRAFLKSQPVGRCVVAPLFVRLTVKKIRQPDVVFAFHEHIAADLRKIQHGADLVMEVVSPGEDSRERDWVEKRELYAAAGIAEYWFVDPEREEIVVFTLNAQGAYDIAGQFKRGSQATSRLLNGFTVDVSATFNAGEVKS